MTRTVRTKLERAQADLDTKQKRYDRLTAEYKTAHDVRQAAKEAMYEAEAELDYAKQHPALRVEAPKPAAAEPVIDLEDPLGTGTTVTP